MKKSDFSGFKQVFLFEFFTGVKKTSFKIFVAVLCIMGFLGLPIMVIVGNIRNADKTPLDENVKSSIESVYVYDDTNLPIDYEVLKEPPKYSEISFITGSSMSYDEAVAALKEDAGSKKLIIKTEYDNEKSFDVTIVRANKNGISKSELEKFEEDYEAFYREEVLKNLGVSKEDYEYLSKDIEVEALKVNEDGTVSEPAESISMEDYFVLLGGLMIVFMFVNMSVGNVATSVATEKSSRVIEYLLTGTRPLALLSGKIAARLLESVIVFFAAYSSYFLSQLVCVFLMSGSTATENVASNMVVVSSFWETITLPKVIIAILYLLAGLAVYTILGAVTGASVSRLEELQDAYKAYTFVLMTCMYADMFLIIAMLSTGGSAALTDFCAIFPLTGAFITPALVLTGKIGILTGVIALIVILVTMVIAFILAAAVYESMLLFQGKRLKAKDIISIMKKQQVVA